MLTNKRHIEKGWTSIFSSSNVIKVQHTAPFYLFLSWISALFYEYYWCIISLSILSTLSYLLYSLAELVSAIFRCLVKIKSDYLDVKIKTKYVLPVRNGGWMEVETDASFGIIHFFKEDNLWELRGNSLHEICSKAPK